jgi:hypothetical protein
MPVRGPILVDTNTILECHRVGCWAGLSGHWSLETVEDCVTETQTGAQKRPPDQRISEAALRSSLSAVSAVAPIELARVALLGGPHLDDGERALWAHALTRADAWRLCGPDRASMKFGVHNRLQDRLVSLGSLLAGAGVRPKAPIKVHFEEAWLRQVVTQILMGGL